MTLEEIAAAYRKHAAGVLYRETLQHPIRNGERILLPAYGWLRGFTIELERPLPNMDVSHRHSLSVQIVPASDDVLVGDVDFRLQMIAEMVGPLSPGKLFRGAAPLLSGAPS